MKISNYLSWNKSDFVKGLVMAFLGVFLASMTDIINAGELPTVEQLKEAGIMGLKVAGVYLFKNLLSNSDGQFLIKEKQKTISNEKTVDQDQSSNQ